MLNSRSIEVVDNSRFGAKFRKPAYGSYCFAHVPATIRSVLGDTSVPLSAQLPADVFPGGNGRTEKIVYLFVDAFGWWFFERFQDRFPFLKRVLKEGVVSKMTSMFPSTTAAHVTTIHTGLPVNESGVVEWYYYEPVVDRVISPLLFSIAGDRQRETLALAGYDPKKLFPTTTQYQALRSIGVPSWIFQNSKYTPSPYSNVVFDGATVIPYKDEASGLRSMAETIKATKGPGYFFIYLDSVDGVCHDQGPEAEKTAATAERLFTAIEQELLGNLGTATGDTTLVALADHGQVALEPERAYYLNREIPDIAKYLRHNRSGDLIPFGGSARDLMLYAKPECVSDLAGMLREKLVGKAEVHLTSELESAGLFGPGGLSPTCRSRMGDLWVLSYELESVYWYEQSKFDVDERGHHGGLTPIEMETALMVLPLG